MTDDVLVGDKKIKALADQPSVVLLVIRNRVCFSLVPRLSHT